MTLKRIVLLGVVVAALALYYNLKEVRLAGEKKKAQELKTKLFRNSKEDIAEFKLVFRDKTVRVKRDEKEWRLLEPLQDRGDQFTLDNMAANLVNSISLRTLLENPDENKLPEYGLGVPYTQVYVKLKGGREEGPLLIGDMSPFEGYVYIRRPGDNTIYLANALLRKGLDKSLYDLRDKVVLHTDEKSLREIELTAPAVLVKVVRDDKGQWRITQPRESEVDGDAMMQMFAALKDSKIRKFVKEEPGPLEPYGLARPHYRITFSPGKDSPVTTLLVGNPAQWEDGIYAKYQDAPKVFVLAKDLWDKMPKSFFDFRKKHVITFSNDQIRKIEIERGGMRLVAEREKQEEWRITSPREVKGGHYEIDGYLYSVKDVKATAFDERRESSAARAFKTPYLTVRLWPDKAQQPITLTVGDKAQKGVGRYARAGSVDELITISDEAVEKLTVDLNALRDKGLASFQEEAVQKMLVKLPGASLMTLQRTGKEKWRLTEPVMAKADPLRVKSILWRLEALRYNEIVSEEPAATDEPSYGFQNPSAQITLWSQDADTPIDIITLGNSTIKKESIYVRVKSKPGVYTTDADLLDKIPKTADEFKRKF